MGIMTDTLFHLRNEMFSMASSVWSGFYKFCEISGYARAASALARQGLHEEAKACMMQAKNLRTN